MITFALSFSWVMIFGPLSMVAYFLIIHGLQTKVVGWAAKNKENSITMWHDGDSVRSGMRLPNGSIEPIGK